MTTAPANQQAKGLARFFDEPELHILKHVRWFLTILGAAVVLHFVTDAAEEHHFPGWFVFILRFVEYLLFVGDAIVFVIAVIVGFIIQVRKIILLLGFDIFSMWPWRGKSSTPTARSG